MSGFIETTKLNIIYCSIFIIAFGSACDSRNQTTSDNPVSNQNVSIEVNSRARTVKYVELSNRKIKDKNENVSKDQALSIADAKFNEAYGKNKPDDAIVCERVMFWSVIYENTGDEYSISKSFGTENTRHTKLPVPAKEFAEVSKNISENEAFEIAKNAFRSYLEQPQINSPGDVERYVASGCEMKNAWRIYFADESSWFKAVYPSSQPPDYLIDKRTGAILYDSKKAGFK